MRIRNFYITLLSIGVVCFPEFGADDEPPPGNWPQWRGPNRDNVSKETGLLKRWPDSGPPLVWEVRGIGSGVAAVAVAGGRIFALGYIDDSEYLTALDERTRKQLWRTRTGPSIGENTLMRWLGQRTPTVDGERVYAFHARGQLVCLETQTGRELWRRDYVKEFGMTSHWGFCDRPLIDGDRLICTPGGKRAAMVALNKVTGDVIWQSPPADADAATAATVVSEGGGVRQYVTFVQGKVKSFRASDGTPLWTHEHFGSIANSNTPVDLKDSVLAIAPYGVGIALLKLSPAEDGVKTELLYYNHVNISPFQDSALVMGKRLYCSGKLCFDVETGKPIWGTPTGGREAMTYADGHLYTFSPDDTVSLVEVTPEPYAVISSFKFPDYKQLAGCTNPVIAGGRLYLRQEDRLFCHDVRESASKEGRSKPEVIVLAAPLKAETPAQFKDIYVPTPQDIVEKMLALAEVKNTDVVYDLGSGDGRIVVTAAKNHGCKAVGYEIDEELVKHSRENVEKAGVKELANIEQKDIFTVDLNPASVITVYLSEKYLEQLKPQLEKLKPGSRIVSHQFQIPGAVPEKTLNVVSPQDGVNHSIYLWTVPLKKAAK